MDHRVQFTATIQELSTDASSLGIPESVYSEIKAKDPNPFWVVLEIGREGTSGGDLGSLGKRVKHWTAMAIKELARKVSGGKVFTDVHGDPSDQGRSTYGRVVHGMCDTVAGKQRATAVAYIADEGVRKRIKSGDLNICSVEAMVNVVKNAVDFIVEGVDTVGGLLMASAKKETAGFGSAGILTSVQELGEEQVMTVTKKDVKAFIWENNLQPKDLFSGDELSKDQIVSGLMDSAVDEKEHELRQEIDKIAGERDAISGELKPLKAKEASVRARALIVDSEDVKKLSKTQGEAVVDMVVDGLGDVSGMSDADLATAVSGGIKGKIDLVKKLSGGGTGTPPKGVPADKGEEDEGGDDNPYAKGIDSGSEDQK